MSLIDKLKKNSRIKETAVLEESILFGPKDTAPTDIPILNIALSGSLHGGVSPGLHVIAGASKNFKSNMGLILASAYMEKHPDAVMLFYDSEFGMPEGYFRSFNIDPSRVVHTPITDIEQLKFDIMGQLEQLERGDKVFFLIDSVGNLASKKEVEDALNEKSVADMSRAKQMKSLFRMVTPHLTLKELPMVAINHVYQSMGLFSQTVVSGGTGVYYSANDIWIITRSQEKDAGDLAGYTFTITIDKSRRVKEKSKLKLTATFEDGIQRHSGLLELALELGFVAKPSNGWYQKVDTETGELVGLKVRAKDTQNSEFWEDILNNPAFEQAIQKKFRLNVE